MYILLMFFWNDCSLTRCETVECCACWNSWVAPYWSVMKQPNLKSCLRRWNKKLLTTKARCKFCSACDIFCCRITTVNVMWSCMKIQWIISLIFVAYGAVLALDKYVWSNWLELDWLSVAFTVGWVTQMASDSYKLYSPEKFFGEPT